MRRIAALVFWCISACAPCAAQLREVDLPALPGVLGLELVRHYSREAALENRRGILGRGWSIGYDWELERQADGAAITVRRADGTRSRFVRSTEPQEPGVAVFRSAKPGQDRLLAHRTGTGTEYSAVFEGKRYVFDAQGNLVRIVASTGEFVHLQRDSAGTLLRVTDPQGRSLAFRYPPAGVARTQAGFEGVQHIDTPVGRFSYAYGGGSLSANLVKVSLPTHYDPATPAHPLGGTGDRGVSSSSVSRIYHHENTRLPMLLTGVSVQGQGTDGKLLNERLATWDAGAPPPGEAEAPDRGCAVEGPDKTDRPSVIPGKVYRLRVEYNSAGQPIRVSEEGFSPVNEQGLGVPGGVPLSRTTEYTYARINGRSVLARVDGPLPNGPQGSPQDSDVTLVEWDARGDHVLQVRYPGGIVRRFEHDHAGRVIRRTGVGGVPEALRYDTQGRIVLWERAGNARLLAYDAAGRLTTIRDSLGRSIEVQHDRARRPRTSLVPLPPGVEPALMRVPEPAAAGSASTCDSRDPLSVCLHDDFGRVVRRVGAGGNRMTYLFDASDALTGRIAADGGRLRIDRDPAGRLVAVRTEGEDARIEWGPAEKPVLIRYKEGEERFEYDAAARLVRHEQRVDGKRWSVGYAYDATGRLLHRRLADGRRLVYRYHGPRNAHAGLLAGIDLEGWVDVPLVKGLHERPVQGATGSLSFWERAASKLSQLGTSGARDDGPEPPDPAPAQARSFDARGRMLDDGSRRYVWDGLDRLTEVWDLGTPGRPARLLARYRHNLFGDRIAQSVQGPGGARVRYFLNEAGLSTAEADATGEVTSQHVYVGPQAVAMLKGRAILAAATRRPTGSIALGDIGGLRDLVQPEAPPTAGAAFIRWSEGAGPAGDGYLAGASRSPGSTSYGSAHPGICRTRCSQAPICG